ncbi:MAG: hypothetical protein LBV26_08190 [Bacteroidales bacterium]|jgi:hypothetical protein|nr:hypothetical protein [Bacteroidales bacterium]
MKHILFASLLLLTVLKGYGQIDMSDSTVQVIGYWDKNEKQSYVITSENIKIQGADTVSRELYRYTVDVTVTDSAANSYTIDWFYRDYEYTYTETGDVMKMLNSLTDNMTVTIKTDELGVFQEVVNWKEIRNHIRKAMRTLKQNVDTLLQPAIQGKLSEPGKSAAQIPDSVYAMFERGLGQVETMFSTKENIEAAAIQEIQQFYTFHGAQYKLWEEYSATMKGPNVLGGEPFDVTTTVWLDEITPGDNDYVIRAKQKIDPQQLREATYSFMVKTAKAMGVAPPSPDDIPPMKNETSTASLIHGSGWVVYSVMTTEVTAEGRTNIKETTIDMQ